MNDKEDKWESKKPDWKIRQENIRKIKKRHRRNKPKRRKRFKNFVRYSKKKR